MKRIPCVPLITVDPYFSIWAKDEHLNFVETTHWTGAERPIAIHAEVDGKRSALVGYLHKDRKAKQISLKTEALTTTAVYETDGVRITLRFMTPLFADDIRLLSRPVSYMAASYVSLDGKEHRVCMDVVVREEMVLDHVWESPVATEEVNIKGLKTIRMGNTVQNVLGESGDNIRANWGYFYLAVADKNAEVKGYLGARHRMYAEADAVLSERKTLLFLFAYDDVASLQYFGENLKSAWNHDGTTIEQAIAEAAHDYNKLQTRANLFSRKLREDAGAVGGKNYADMLSLAYRQVMAAHKVAIDGNGELLFVSKECFSNGCAATVDISYPSAPMFLLYNPELIKGMMRPIYRFAADKMWPFDFAPHDVGQFPLLNRQVYGLKKETGEYMHESQMPVEECGNMIIMEACIALATGDASFAASHMDTLTTWCRYLIENGEDPAEQLCTDDFSGHLAHNCNLSVKAVMGIEGMAQIMRILGREKEEKQYHETARKMAESWVAHAKNADGTTRLAFDAPDTFSLKYNMVWDKIWGTNLFPADLYDTEVKSYISRSLRYGVPLDNRADFTKSDWLMWVATLASSPDDFEKLTRPMGDFYSESPSRVPMTDWYDAESGYQVSFQNRTVQGGLFIKLLDAGQTLKIKK